MEVLDLHLGSLVNGLLRATLEASVIAALILGVQYLLRDRLPARWHYALWLVLLIRMAVPWNPESSLSVFNLLPLPASQVSQTGDMGWGAAGPGLGSLARSGTAAESAAVMPQEAAAPWGYLTSPVFLLTGCWLAGMLAFAGCVGAHSLRLWWRVREARPITEGHLLEVLATCREAMGIRTPVDLVQTSAASTPALFALFRPRILLPGPMAQSLSPAELRHVFLHELAHLRCHDIAVNWLITALQAVH